MYKNTLYNTSKGYYNSLSNLSKIVFSKKIKKKKEKGRTNIIL